MAQVNLTNVNIGCGSRLVKGYINFDNSFSVKLSKLPLFFIGTLYTLKILTIQHYDYIKFLKMKFLTSSHFNCDNFICDIE